jgi:predicted DNA-binding transcriptional regulator YafY
LTKRGKALEVELEVYNSKELVSEILKYGELVKVIAPLSLANTIKEKTKKITELY